jgi:hypothetical protein
MEDKCNERIITSLVAALCRLHTSTKGLNISAVEPSTAHKK